MVHATRDKYILPHELLENAFWVVEHTQEYSGRLHPSAQPRPRNGSLKNRFRS